MKKNLLFISIIYLSPCFASVHQMAQKLTAEQIVKQYCSTCHAKQPLIELGAPKIGNTQDWEVRLKQGVKMLLKHTMNGWRAMPARGGCFDCSDQQLEQAISILIDNKK